MNIRKYQEFSYNQLLMTIAATPTGTILVDRGALPGGDLREHSCLDGQRLLPREEVDKRYFDYLTKTTNSLDSIDVKLRSYVHTNVAELPDKLIHWAYARLKLETKVSEVDLSSYQKYLQGLLKTTDQKMVDRFRRIIREKLKRHLNEQEIAGENVLKQKAKAHETSVMTRRSFGVGGVVAVIVALHNKPEITEQAAARVLRNQAGYNKFINWSVSADIKGISSKIEDLDVVKEDPSLKQLIKDIFEKLIDMAGLEIASKKPGPIVSPDQFKQADKLITIIKPSDKDPTPEMRLTVRVRDNFPPTINFLLRNSLVQWISEEKRKPENRNKQIGDLIDSLYKEKKFKITLLNL